MATSSTKQVEEAVNINISAAVLVSRYLGFWRRILSWSLLISLVELILRQSAPWAILVVGSALGYTVVLYPTRWTIQCWTWLCLVAAPTLGVWLSWELVVLLRDNFAAGLIILFADIGLFFLV